MYRTRAIIYKGNLNIIKLIQVKDNLEQNYVILVYNKPLVIILLFQLNIDFGFGFGHCVQYLLYTSLPIPFRQQDITFTIEWMNLEARDKDFVAIIM